MRACGRREGTAAGRECALVVSDTSPADGPHAIYLFSRWLPLTFAISGACLYPLQAVDVGLYTTWFMYLNHHLLTVWASWFSEAKWILIRFMLLPAAPSCSFTPSPHYSVNSCGAAKQACGLAFVLLPAAALVTAQVVSPLMLRRRSKAGGRL